jgi:hypothetical protein
VVVFANRSDADAAQNAATDTLPDDKLITGQEGPVQITTRWADIPTLTDGGFAFPIKPGMALPTGAMQTDDISALLSPAVRDL